MWKRIVGVALALAASATPLAAAQITAVATAAMPFHRGVNVLGYDPYWNDVTKRRFQWRHFTEIRNAGFDFVRLNLAAFRHMDASNRLDPAWLAKLDDVVRESQKAGLGIIIDEHDFNQCSESVDTCRQKLIAFWGQVAPRFRKAPRNVAFEILNEPHAALDAAAWNGVFADLLADVRKTNPTRIIVVGPTSWNSLKELPTLEIPNDPNLLVTFHYYEPFHFTHQGATWVPEVTRLRGITWGSAEDRAALRADFDEVGAWAVANHRPILLGEFGAYDKSGTPMDLRVTYTAAVRCEAQRHGFGWAYWQFDSDFIAWDMKTDSWVKPIKDALVPPAGAPAGC